MTMFNKNQEKLDGVAVEEHENKERRGQLGEHKTKSKNTMFFRHFLSQVTYK